MAKEKQNIIGAWAFLIGVVLALIVGALGLEGASWSAALVVLGIVIGLLNIGGTELKEFMLAGTVLVVVSAFGSAYGNLLGLSISIINIGAILSALLALFVPATIVVALKTVFALARR